METENNVVLYCVVVNHEAQYSIWPIDKRLPEGWQKEEFSGEKVLCLNYIGKIWNDLRPLSLRTDSNS